MKQLVGRSRKIAQPKYGCNKARIVEDPNTSSHNLGSSSQRKQQRSFFLFQTMMVNSFSTTTIRLLRAVVLMTMAMLKVAAQDERTGFCSCSPSVWTFQLRFDLTCPGTIGTDTTGIEDLDCQIESVGEIDDLIPTTISRIQVLELDGSLAVLKSVTQEAPQEGIFTDGYEFDYTSVAVDNPNFDSLIGGVQMTLNGLNQFGNPVVNTWLILFDNSCNVYPLLGEQIGWTEVVSSTLPQARLCPGKSVRAPVVRMCGKANVAHCLLVSPGIPTASPSEAPSISLIPSSPPTLTLTPSSSLAPSSTPSVVVNRKPAAHPTRAMSMPGSKPSRAPIRKKPSGTRKSSSGKAKSRKRSTKNSLRKRMSGKVRGVDMSRNGKI